MKWFSKAISGNNFLFVHIPKTAGTSFRISVKNYFQLNSVFFDYGKSTKTTSSLVKKYVYKLNDCYGLFTKISSKSTNLLAGHFPLNKYIPMYNLKNVICFVREPAQQLRSHFEHLVRLDGYKKNFIEFIQEPRVINFQSRYLRGHPIEAIGFIGLTESYDKSLEMINEEYGFSIPVIQLNNNNNKTSELYELSDEEMELIRDLNQEDYALYNKAKDLFERRIKCKNLGLPFFRGELTLRALPKSQRDLSVRGWLLNLASNDIVKGYVLINDQIKVDFEAKDYRPWVKERIEHRLGYVGFHEKLSNPLKEGDVIKLFDENDLFIDSYIYK